MYTSPLLSLIHSMEMNWRRIVTTAIIRFFLFYYSYYLFIYFCASLTGPFCSFPARWLIACLSVYHGQCDKKGVWGLRQDGARGHFGKVKFSSEFSSCGEKLVSMDMLSGHTVEMRTEKRRQNRTDNGVLISWRVREQVCARVTQGQLEINASISMKEKTRSAFFLLISPTRLVVL